ncbi:uncharacterized protein LOC112528798 [Cynara cardunculus var. scolymus]|uniref:Cotton fiber protein n=1 Tax=Cynara cardunculus var. scolymus TaxID=59895 RepID=A0A118JWP8_CYNCS|nr:uncharacterized protein LOC112528798 [Cynara cardunculus var. scolymus]KVH96277.1 Protein of unknown function DUF761, plant [Cynara cardunculus var. scolymus]
MGKRRSPILAKVSNLIKISIFIAKMRLVYLKKSTKLSKFRSLKHYNSYGCLQEHQFSPSSTPLIRFHHRKTNGGSVYSVFFLSCFRGRHQGGVMMVDESYSLESAAIVEVERDGSELSYGYGEQEEDDDDSVDERAEKFIERFYEEMKKQRRESSSSSADLPLNRLLEY